MNNVSLLGRLTTDAELRQTANNIPVCRFTIAVARPGVKDKTDFINCVAWRQQAEFIAKYFTKGKPIALTGVLTSGSYQKDGVTHYTTDVLINNADFVLSDKKQDTGTDSSVPKEQEPEETPPDSSDYEEIINDGDLPF